MKIPLKLGHYGFLFKTVLLMKALLLFFCLSMLQANTSVLGQRINLKLNNSSLENALFEISKQAKRDLVFNSKSIKTASKVHLDIRNSSLEKALSNALRNQPFEYEIRKNTIIVKPISEIKQRSILKESEDFSQQKIISGKITDTLGMPIEGVNVIVKGISSLGTTTDKNGRFILEIPTQRQVLVIKHMGYLEKEVFVGNEIVFDIILNNISTDIDEVVVVAFGTQKKASVVGAISTVDPTFLQQNQTRSISNSLAGQAGGIIAVQRSGEPGYDNSDFWIRGINTFGANKNPMILIDGIERSLNNISPEEIESFSILKDASATALYGVRGANGVILIQTKKGKVGKPRINMKSDFGFTTPTQLPEFVDAPKYMEIVNEAFTNSYLQPIYKQEKIENTRNNTDLDLYPNVNWLDAVTRKNVPTHRVSVDINGGTDLLRYSLITAYHSEEGMIKSDKDVNYDSQLKLKKYNVRSNIDLKLTNSTNVNVSIGGYILNRNAPGVNIPDILFRTFNTPPDYHPVVYSNGQIPQVGARYNPWADAVHSGFKKNYENNVESLISLTQNMGSLWKKLEGLQIDARFSFDAFSTAIINRTKSPTTYLAYGRDEDGKLLTSMTTQGQEFLGYGRDAGGTRSMYFESKANYEKAIQQHNIGAMVLFYLRDHIITNAGDAILSLPYRTQGLASRFLYNYADRYFMELNMGYNGSENFAKGYRFGFFPSVAVGWMVSNEAFFEPIVNTFNSLKIRGSYGVVGNDQLSGRRFAYLSTIEGRPGYSFGYAGEYGLGGWGEGQFGISTLTWETAKKLNVGVDVELFSKVKLAMDYFRERREDIFMQRKSIPEIAGYQNMPWANFGVVMNKGFEANIDYNQRVSDELLFTLRGSFTYAKNRIVEIDEPETLKRTSRSQTGNPLNQHYGLKALRLYQEDDFIDPINGVLKEEFSKPTFGVARPGDIQYQDLNGDGVIDSYDESAIGRPYIPEIVYGFGLTLRYKQIDFGTFFQGTGNFTNMLAGGTFIPGSGAGGTGNIYANVDNRWTIESPKADAFWPRLSNNTSENNMRSSTWWMMNSSFLRMKNLELGYTFKRPFKESMGIKSFRVFLRGSNLVTFSSFKMWDPEIGSSDGLRYPLNKIYSAGIDILF